MARIMVRLGKLVLGMRSLSAFITSIVPSYLSVWLVPAMAVITRVLLLTIIFSPRALAITEDQTLPPLGFHAGQSTGPGPGGGSVYILW